MQIKFNKIISLLLIPTILFMQVTPAYAIMSPIILDQIQPIRDHINLARSKNGYTTPGEILNFILKKDKEQNEEAIKNNSLTAVSPELTNYMKDIRRKRRSMGVDDFALIFGIYPNGNPISACLRDDIWELQDLQDEVESSLLKAAVLYDRTTAPILWGDWQLINDFIETLDKYYKNPTGPSPFFVDSVDQYLYANCTKGEYKEAFRDFLKSWGNFKKSFGTADWGNLKTAIKVKAQRDALKWNRANQLTLRLGGTNGANTTQLFKDGEFKGKALIGSVGESLVALDAVGGIIANTARALYTTVGYYFGAGGDNYSSIISKISEASKKEEKALLEARLPIKYKLTFDTVGENTIRKINNQLFDINFTVKQALAEKDSLKTYYNNVLIPITKYQCSQ